MPSPSVRKPGTQTDAEPQTPVTPELLSLVVHELRTPLTVVAGYLRMLFKEQAGPLSEVQKRLVEEAERSCGRLSGMVAQLSELANLERGALSLANDRYDLVSVLREVVDEITEGRDRGLAFELEAPAGEAPAQGDRARVKAAFAALLLASARERADGTVAVRCTVNDREADAVVAIGDTPEAPGGAFDEYRGGMGLSLSVARRVIERFGGAVSSAGLDGERSTTVIRLPLAR